VNQILAQWATILISLIIAVTGLYLAIANRRVRLSQVDRDESSASAAITKSALSLVAPMQTKITALETQLTEQSSRLTNQSQRISDLEHGISIRDAELEGLRAGIVVLTSQLKRLNIIPEYNPPPHTGPLAQKS
jgi:hypothetical protein